MARVLLGVTGGIAAYKAAELMRLLVKAGHEVTPILTAGAETFVTAKTFEAIARREAPKELYPHLAQADLLVIAPLSANTLAKLAHGLADNVLTQTALAFEGPVLVAPAMNPRMWAHRATRDNVAKLRERGVVLVGPDEGELAEGEWGVGRISEPDEIFGRAETLLARRGQLAGKRVLVSAGGTREPLDAVRFLGNRSSGKQGYALAAVAAARGADVTLVAANTSLPAPAGVHVVPVGTVLELRAAVTAAAKEADVVVMAAAPADFRPAHYSEAKIKKTFAGDDPDHDTSAPTIELVRNPDVLAGLVAARGSGSSPVIVGFAAETGDADHTVLEHARAKLERKRCDVMVANEVGVDKTFGQDSTSVHILRRGSDAVTDAGPASKEEVAATVWDVIQDVLQPR